jgi:hypothetical protein
MPRLRRSPGNRRPAAGSAMLPATDLAVDVAYSGSIANPIAGHGIKITLSGRS